LVQRFCLFGGTWPACLTAQIVVFLTAKVNKYFVFANNFDAEKNDFANMGRKQTKNSENFEQFLRCISKKALSSQQL